MPSPVQRGGDPCRFYLPSANPDFLEGADCTLRVGGTSLPIHTAIVAARASAFSPLLAMNATAGSGSSAARELTEPLGIDSLPAELLFLRLCYQPECAGDLCAPAVLPMLPGGGP